MGQWMKKGSGCPPPMAVFIHCGNVSASDKTQKCAGQTGEFAAAVEKGYHVNGTPFTFGIQLLESVFTGGNGFLSRPRLSVAIKTWISYGFVVFSYGIAEWPVDLYLL